MPPLSCATRSQRLIEHLSRAEPGGPPPIDALLVSDRANIRWLTGFTGSNGWVVISPQGNVLVTDGRYADQAEAELAAAGVHCQVVIGYTAAEVQSLVLVSLAAFSTVGFEASHMTVAEHQRWTDGFPGTLAPTAGLVERCRRHKDPGEIARITLACQIADESLAVVGPMLGTGATEAQVRNALEAQMRNRGASGPSYETIVASGPVHAARPHHQPTDLAIEAGHTVVIDVGALVDGYHSDMTRSFVIGSPTALQSELYELVLAAQLAGLAAVRPGALVADIDAACRNLIADAGYSSWFSHGTGHGVGLNIHEDPFIGRAGGFVLEQGDVVTIEPGVYRDGFGGFRVEDLVVVTSTGGLVLTASPKDSPCLPSPPTI